MIKKIVIDNFMAHERTEIELGPGVTALTGPNNTGKSAVVEALRCVATNPVPKHYIRHGAKEARVTVEIDDGTKVVWIRKKRSSGYELWHPGAEEPEEYWKFGRKPPEDVLKALKLDLVELETGGEIDVHVGNQREPVFLLNQPSSNAAAFFAASTESAHLLAMQNLLKRQTQDAKRQRRDLEGRMHGIEAEIDKLEMLPDIDLQIEAARELGETAKGLQSDIPILESLLTNHASLTKSLAGKKASTGILNTVSEPPKMNLIEGLQSLVGRIESVNHNLSSARKVSDALGSLAPMSQVHDTSTLARLCSELHAAEGRLRKAEVVGEALAGLSVVPEVDDTAQLSNIIDQIITLHHRTKRLSQWSDSLQTVAESPVIQSDEHLLGLLANIRDIEGKKRDADGALLDLETRLKGVAETLSVRISEIGCCPTCGADINTEAFIDRGCQHDA